MERLWLVSGNWKDRYLHLRVQDFKAEGLKTHFSNRILWLPIQPPVVAGLWQINNQFKPFISLKIKLSPKMPPCGSFNLLFSLTGSRLAFVRSPSIKHGFGSYCSLFTDLNASIFGQGLNRTLNDPVNVMFLLCGLVGFFEHSISAL